MPRAAVFSAITYIPTFSEFDGTTTVSAAWAQPVSSGTGAEIPVVFLWIR